MRWTNLESIIQSEVGQKEKYKYHILTHICYPYQKDMLTKFLGNRIRVHLINMEDVERHLGLIEDDDDNEEEEDD